MFFSDRSPFSRRKSECITLLPLRYHFNIYSIIIDPLAEIPKAADKKSTPKVNHMQLLQSQSSTQKKGETTQISSINYVTNFYITFHRRRSHT